MYNRTSTNQGVDHLQPAVPSPLMEILLNYAWTFLNFYSGVIDIRECSNTYIYFCYRAAWFALEADFLQWSMLARNLRFPGPATMSLFLLNVSVSAGMCLQT